MDNNLRNIEKSLRSSIKRFKGITYTKELLFAFLVTGSFAQATQKKSDNNSISEMKKDLKTSIVTVNGAGRSCGKVSMEFMAVWSKLLL